ncbi:hypothetical protein [Occallatibacter riparius]|uniref:Uncharacterized protein n=1 Tax=Occallatibacter riparius TaxID=1002689 RepID=A0A9J7BFF7_9BACT|nr:hypothetical protein [Occallatibacter riparius]UWZ81740.1 hypothetical protein MOP44_14215 [Occallatibacter riparius]
MISDGYAQWYADRLWQMLPAIYRAMDTGPVHGAPGPLQELVNRIGAQAAVVRRNIDRLGQNQSIETCDDWGIPYIGDLVATRLVACLDSAAQRIDVAKTVYYRRRAGTVGVLEELAADIASRDARVVEFFRRLGRTRHQFDPPLSYQIENPITGPVGFTGNALEIAEGLIGAYSGTPAGGFADLRKTYPASNTGSAFDEYFYTADLRAGGQTLGHFNIRNLGVFLWWLKAFPIAGATPVSNGANPPCLTFDPTGRAIPLFAPSQRVAEAGSWGEHWVSPDEWELPVAIRETLWATVPDKLYPATFTPEAFSVGLIAAGSGAALPLSQLAIQPSAGRFSFVGGQPVGTLAVCYNFGLASEIGAGGYNTQILNDLPIPEVTTTISGGNGSDIDSALAAVTADANIEIADTLTYAGPTQTLTVPAGATVVVAARSGERPVLRWPTGAPQTWTIVGQAAASGNPTVLVLEGLLLQGADIVLQGSFDSVYLRMMTLDPGTSYAAPIPCPYEQPGPPPNPLPMYGTAIDGMPLAPVTLYVEGSVTNLILERTIVGPIRTRFGGAIESMTASDCILQSIPSHTVAKTGTLNNPTIFDSASLAASLKYQTNSLAKKAVTGNSALISDLNSYTPGTIPSSALIAAMTAAIQQFTAAEAEKAWPLALADLALGFAEGNVSLSRCTVLGASYTHRLSASESILDGLATVEDPQAGCVRFTAYAKGSNLHQPYRSVEITPGAPIFESRAFGNPEYAKLRSDADAQILAPGHGGSGCGDPNAQPAKPGTILEGAQNGSEMGVYCLEGIPLKRRGLALKFEEYSPIGQLPVWIDVD